MSQTDSEVWLSIQWIFGLVDWNDEALHATFVEGVSEQLKDEFEESFVDHS